MASYKDYYKILGVSKNATDAEIKKAFKTAARKYHPDLHPESKKAEMTEKFKDVNEAYAVLSDWGVTCCEDVGEIVFNLYDAKRIGKTYSDSRADFIGGFDFKEEFLGPYGG